MKKRKQFALNRLFNFCVVIGLFLAWGSVDLFIENEIAWGFSFAIVALLVIMLPSIFTPYCYAFDCEGVSLCYVFLPVERYLWKDIYAISVDFNSSSTRSNLFSNLFDLFFSSVFAIGGKNVGQSKFYMKGYIRKSFRTKYLLEKYWDGEITGYFFEDTKKWLRKRKEKNDAQIAAHLTDEIVPMEREIRAEAREWLGPLIDQAKYHGIYIKSKYVYITKGYVESNSRPHEGYTYTLDLEIARDGETDEDKILVSGIDLLYVRLGKTSYRGVKNETAREELEYEIQDAIAELTKIE